MAITLTPTQEDVLVGFIGQELERNSNPDLQEIYDLLIGPTLPCNTCGEPVDKDIHAEELGFCVDCSYNYFDERNN
jgi:hypothetical protein